MLQKKREQLHREIRRKQLDQLFSNKRNALMGESKMKEILDQIQESQVARRLSQHLKKIVVSINAGQINDAVDSVEAICLQINQNQVSGSIYLMRMGSNYAKVMGKVIANQQKMEDNSEWVKLDERIQRDLLQKLIGVLLSINYKQVEQQYFFNILASFWLIFTDSQLDILDPQQTYFLTLILSTLKHMLQYNNKTVIKCLKQVGLGSQLTKIIQNSHILNNYQQKEIITIIQMYIYQQNYLQELSENNIEGVYIVGMESNQKQVFMAFCLSIIDRRCHQLYVPAVNTLILIFQKHSCLSQTIELRFYYNICELLQIQDRQLQQKVIQLIDDIIYYNQEAAQQLIQDMYLPNLLLQLLQKQILITDRNYNKIPQKCSYILCNLTLTKKAKQIQQFKFHPIWQFAYSNIYQQSPLLPFINVFEYYFDILQSNMVITILQNYFTAISQLQFDHLNPILLEVIKRTIVRVNQLARNVWGREQQQQFMQLLVHFRLNYLVQNMIQWDEEIYSI